MTSGHGHASLYSSRRTVRIIKPRSVQRAALVTLSGIATLGFLGFLGFRLLGAGESTIVAESRRLEDVPLTWRCDAGHTFTSPGQYGSGVCPRCAVPAYPMETFDCRQHGPVVVLVQFENRDGDEAHVARYRVMGMGRDWLENGGELTCPRCREALTRRPRDPLAGWDRAKRRDTRPTRPGPEPDEAP